MVAKSVIRSVREYLAACRDRGVHVNFGVVFGSQATGKAHDSSDIDLIVVASKYDSMYKYKDVSLLWHLAGKINHMIEPIPCGERQWETDDENVIIEIARREGERVYLEEELAGV